MADKARKPEMKRRDFLRTGLRCAAGLAAAGAAAGVVRKATAETVWQLDPEKCVQCGRCATDCVLSLSAVKCVHAYDVCGYCNLCGGFHRPTVKVKDTAAENQLCPVDAIERTYIEDPYFQYSINESRCNGCAICVKGCGSFGNGSLYLQVRHDRCVNCNECAIARVCPSGAFKRVPVDEPYLLKGKQGEENV